MLHKLFVAGIWALAICVTMIPFGMILGVIQISLGF